MWHPDVHGEEGGEGRGAELCGNSFILCQSRVVLTAISRTIPTFSKQPAKSLQLEKQTGQKNAESIKKKIGLDLRAVVRDDGDAAPISAHGSLLS